MNTKELDYMSYIVLRMFENTEVGYFLPLSFAKLNIGCAIFGRICFHGKMLVDHCKKDGNG